MNRNVCKSILAGGWGYAVSGIYRIDGLCRYQQQKEIGKVQVKKDV